MGPMRKGRPREGARLRATLPAELAVSTALFGGRGQLRLLDLVRFDRILEELGNENAGALGVVADIGRALQTGEGEIEGTTRLAAVDPLRVPARDEHAVTDEETIPSRASLRK